MKEIVKKILPGSALNLGRKGRDYILLQTCATLKFDPKNLRSLASLNIHETLEDATCAADWERDSAEIAKIFPTDNRAGGINPGDRRALYTLIRALKPQRVLEVGTHIGASSLHIAMALKANGGGRLTTVDIVNVNDNDAPWRAAGLSQTPQQTLGRAICADRVEFVAAPSLNYMNASQEKFDFIFLDGDHSSVSVYREVAAALKLLNAGGIILLHDYYVQGQAMFPDGNVIPGPFLGVERIMRDCPDIAVRPLGDLPWFTKQGSNRTTLALLLKND